MTIEELREKGWIAYEYIRGSHMYGLNIETSDKDVGGVFFCPQEYLYGLRSEYIEQVSDEKNDTVYYEFGRWVELLLKSNPTALEGLFAPKECIIGEVHPAIQHIIDHRDEFISKECFKTFYGYAVSQIGKARGLNKKIVNPIIERKSLLDFCYVWKDQGSTKVVNWLANHGLKQKYCGLVLLPNMHDDYGLYYDWGTHIICEYGVDLRDNDATLRLRDELKKEYIAGNTDRGLFFKTFLEFNSEDDFVSIMPYGFTGIVKEDADSNDVRVCVVPKGIKPLILMCYNQTGYSSHCRDYKAYKEWEEKRNPVRYEGNLNKNYDSKNIMHCMRLVRMAKELAQGKGFNVVRTWDRDYLLDIRNHKYEYEEVMSQLETEKKEMEEAIKTCNIQDKVNFQKINQLLIDSRKKLY